MPQTEEASGASAPSAWYGARVHARRHVTLMVIPLAVIALGMVAAVLVPYGTPLAWLPVTLPLHTLSPFLVIHVVAAVLAVTIARAARGDAPPGHVATIVALIGIVALTVLTVIAVKAFSDVGAWTPVLAFVAPVALAPVIAVHALRASGWERMLLLLGALAVAALPYACPLVPGVFGVLSSGLVHAVANVTLLVLFVLGMRSPTTKT